MTIDRQFSVVDKPFPIPECFLSARPMVTSLGGIIMTVLLIWSLVDTQSPRIITSDMRVIDLSETAPAIWVSYISEENKLRVVDEVRRWEVAAAAGADAIEAYGYAVGGISVDFQTWLINERESCSS
jgi:hypothetical protein